MTRLRIISVSTAAVMSIAAAVLSGPAGAAPVTSGTPGDTTTATTADVTPTPTQVVTTTDTVVTPTPATPKPTTSTPTSVTSTGPVSTDPATTTSVESTPTDGSAESSAAPVPRVTKKIAVQAASGIALTIGVSSFSGPATITPGTTWTGTGSVTVIGTQGLLSGWVATARLSALTGSKGSVLTPTSATYNATGTGCSGSTVSTTVPLTSSDATIRTAGALCVIAGWNMTVAIAVPASGVLADTYSGTLTQSIA